MHGWPGKSISSKSLHLSDSFESSLFPDPNTEENREHLFVVDNQVVNDLRRHTRAYVKSIGGLPIIPDLP